MVPATEAAKKIYNKIIEKYVESAILCHFKMALQ